MLTYLLPLDPLPLEGSVEEAFVDDRDQGLALDVGRKVKLPLRFCDMPLLLKSGRGFSKIWAAVRYASPARLITTFRDHIPPSSRYLMRVKKVSWSAEFKPFSSCEPLFLTSHSATRHADAAWRVRRAKVC